MMARGTSVFLSIATATLVAAAFAECASAFVTPRAALARPSLHALSSSPRSSSPLNTSEVNPAYHVNHAVPTGTRSMIPNQVQQSSLASESAKISPRSSSSLSKPNKQKRPQDAGAGQKGPTTNRRIKVGGGPNLSLIQSILLVDLWKDDDKLVFAALQKLAELCSANEDEDPAMAAQHRAVVFELGGPSIVVGVMLKEEWAHVAPIQAQGCGLLHALAQNHAPFRQSINKYGVLDTVGLAMMMHPNHVDVQDYGCGVLGEAILSKENAVYCVDNLNAIRLIVSAMHNFRNEARVQLNAAIALFFLLEWSEFKELVEEADGDMALLEARKNHRDESAPYVDHIQKWTRLALLRLFQ